MMAKMQETVQRMNQLQERAHKLTEQAQLQVQDRARMTERERLMLRTSESFEQHAQQLKEVAERTQDMIRSRDFQRDQQMQRDMDRLREHLNTMGTQLDESLQLMERLRLRARTLATQ
jgi:cysteinyl-tRNA synthetase